jgi:methionyl-tRNA formyltransferase
MLKEFDIKLSDQEIRDNRIGFSEQLVEKIANKSDTGVHLGVGLLIGSILTKPEHGVLSYHHGDIRQYRGANSGFWEFVNDEKKMGVTLQQLTENLDAGKVVVYEPVDISDARTLSEVRRRSRNASISMLSEAVKKLNDFSFASKDVNNPGKVYLETDKNNKLITLIFLFKELIGRIGKYLRI